MKKDVWIKPLFWIAGLYDGILGLAFLFSADRIFAHFEVMPPNHLGYVHFPALLLILFGLMFFAIAANPSRNRMLIPYGVGLKVAYCGTVFWHHLTEGVPAMWIPFAYADLIFLALFLIAWVRIPRDRI